MNTTFDLKHKTITAFADTHKIASGSLREVAAKVKESLQEDRKSTILIFDDVTSQQIEIDLRGSLEAVLRRIDAAHPLEEVDGEKKAGPGRPKLGVVSREVTLLPRHWDWLTTQPGGASVTLRKLVEEAKKKNLAKDLIRGSQEATHKFMTAMAGNLPSFEEALRALYARDRGSFEKNIKSWPKDIRQHTRKLAELALAD